MKIKLEFDLTPEEFRSSLGLPDISGLQEKALAALQSRMATDLKDVNVPEIVEHWFSQGLATSRQMQKLFTSVLSGAVESATAGKEQEPGSDDGDGDR